MRTIALLFAFVLTECAGDRLRAEAKPTAVALSAPPTAFLFMIAAAQAAFFWIQLQIMREGMRDATAAAKAATRGAEAAIEANNLNRDNFARGQRPWLSISSLEFTSAVKFVEGGALTTVKFKVRNTGKSPALNVGIDAVFVLQKTGERFDVDEGKFRASLIERTQSFGEEAAFPNADDVQERALSVTKEEINGSSVKMGEIRGIFPKVLIGVCYKSSFGDQYITIATFMTRGIRLDLTEFPIDALQPALFRCQAT